MKRKLLLVGILLLLHVYAHAVIVGSNESVSVQSHVNFPAADTDNSILNFAFMKNGFSLQDASTTCTFSSVYPVGGVGGHISLNGGTLVLHSDLILAHDAHWLTAGFVDGNDRQIVLDHDIDVWPAGANHFKNVHIFGAGETLLTDTLLFEGDCIFDGRGNGLDLGPNGFIIVAPNTTLILRHTALNNVHGTNLQCVDDSSTIIFDDVIIRQSGDYAFSKGSFSILNTIDWEGAFTFTYDSMQSSTVQTESTFTIEDLTFFIGRSADNAPVEPLVFTDATSVLLLQDATLSINSHGVRFTKGTLETINACVIDVASTSTATALEFGDGNILHDMSIQFNGGSQTTFSKGLVVWNNAAIDLIHNQIGKATAVQGAQSIFLFQQDYLTSNLTFDPQVGSQIQVAPGKTLSFNNMVVVTPHGGSYTITGIYQVGIGWMLLSNQSMLVNAGDLNVALLVEGVGNFLGGAGNITFPVVLLNSGAQLTWALTGQVETDLIMSGGSLSLASNMNLGHTIKLAGGGGTVHLNNFSFNLGDVVYRLGTAWVDPIYWDGGAETGVVSLNSEVELDTAWTFSGNNTIKGNGNRLNLLNGNLVIEKGSVLELHNIIVNNISGSNVECLDDAGVLILNNVTWGQDDNFTFTHGTLVVVGKTTFQGDSGTVFAYQSPAPIIVISNTQWQFDSRFTFSYDTFNPNLLQFADETAGLVFNGGGLYAAQNLNLTTGSLLVQNSGFLSSSSTSTITLGDCINSAHDLHTTLLGGSQLSVSSGSLNYKNLNASSWIMQNFFSNMSFANGTALNLYQSLNVGTGFATFGNAILGRSPGIELTGSVNEQGVLNLAILPPC